MKLPPKPSSAASKINSAAIRTRRALGETSAAMVSGPGSPELTRVPHRPQQIAGSSRWAPQLGQRTVAKIVTASTRAVKTVLSCTHAARPGPRAGRCPPAGRVGHSSEGWAPTDVPHQRRAANGPGRSADDDRGHARVRALDDEREAAPRL